VSDLAGVLVLGGPSHALAELAADAAGPEHVADLEQCLERLRGDVRRVPLVLIDPAWPQPLSTVRDLRRANEAVGLAVATVEEEAGAMRSRVAFLPDVGQVHVVAVDVAAQELRSRLGELTASVQQRQRVRGALDAINRDLAQGATAGRGPAASAVSEHYLAALVRHAADTIVSVDPHGHLVSINDAGQHTLRLDPAAAEGRTLGDLLAPDDPGGLSLMLTAAAAGEVQVEDELTVHLAHGRRLILSATAAPVLDAAGSLAGLVLIARDVTAERQAEQRLQALQKAETLATLATGVAHDFNNLLVQVQGWADLAAEDPTDTPLVTEALDHIGEATRHASGLARAMLAYGGRGRFEPEHLRLGGLIGDLEPLLAATVPPKIRLDLDLADDPGVHADATQLRQVVINLVTNAVEAIGEREGTIAVRTGAVTLEHAEVRPGVDPPLAAGSYAVIEVADSGPGVDPEHADRLFDPFYTTKFTGRGLGLAASQGIARAHGGGILLDRDPGEGARFRVHLPATG
jgi:PAS domain S-box-containing protein